MVSEVKVVKVGDGEGMQCKYDADFKGSKKNFDILKKELNNKA